MTHIMRIDEMMQNGGGDEGEYAVPELDYNRPTNEGYYELKGFLKNSGLMPKEKVQHEGANSGYWSVMIQPDDYGSRYVLFYGWYDRFDEYSSTYLVFLEDGVNCTHNYRYEKNKKVLEELDKIVEVFGKSKEWDEEKG